MEETEHELPCGHTLPTSRLLGEFSHFASQQMRGSVDCPDCGRSSVVEFARMSASDGREEFPATYVSTGTLESAPGIIIAIHQRRRVQGLVIDGHVAHLGGQSWDLLRR